MKGHEAVIIRADGAQIPVEVASVRTSWGGKPAFQVIMRDMSERKLAEEAARARLARRATLCGCGRRSRRRRRRDGPKRRRARGERVGRPHARPAAARGSRRRHLHRRRTSRRHDPAGTFSPDELPIAAALDRGEVTTNVVLGVRDDEGRDQWLSVSARPAGGPGRQRGRRRLLGLRHHRAQAAHGQARLGGAPRPAHRVSPTGRASSQAAQRAHDLRHRTRSDPGAVLLRPRPLQARQRLARTRCRKRGPADRRRAPAPGDAQCARALQAPRRRVRCARARCERHRHRACSAPRSSAHVSTQPMRLSTGRTLTITPSVGVVLFEDGPADAASLLQDADMAMLQAKTRGRGRVAVFDAGLREEVGQRLELEHDLRSAIPNGELRLEYQPVASLSSGKILGMEALVRWEHPEKGLLLPLKFIRSGRGVRPHRLSGTLGARNGLHADGALAGSAPPGRARVPRGERLAPAAREHRARCRRFARPSPRASSRPAP